MTKTIDLYDGAIQANSVGSFIKCGLQLHVIRPGYDIQGRKHAAWTQIVHDGIPLFTARLAQPIPDIIKRFDEQWDAHIGKDTELRDLSLQSNRHAHISRFRNGVSGESAAPTHANDGKMQPKVVKST